MCIRDSLVGTHAHGRLGARNPSFGRNLSKINIAAAATVRDEEAPQSAKLAADGMPLMSPRQKQSMKRTQTSLALMPKTASSAGLKKNHSSGQLHKSSSTKHTPKRPDMHRSQSHPGKTKHKQSPPARQQQTAVHFDVGSEDEETEDMEGVDDAWTEDSASQSPNTTRENTRSNTRQNSVILDPAQNPNLRRDDEPPDKGMSSSSLGRNIETVQARDFANSDAPRSRASYQENPQIRPPDAEAISKRLLLRSHQQNPPPRVSDISATASVDSTSAKQVAAPETGPSVPGSVGSAPLVSRFITGGSTPGSKDGTPHASSISFAQNEHNNGSQSQDDSGDIKRNQSTPNFVVPYSPIPSEGGSGTNTPGGPLRQSRTQQKLWLQRGLSNIEAKSQQQLSGLGGLGHPASIAMRQYEKVEKEYLVVRRFRDPISEAMERLTKLHSVNSKAPSRTNSGISPKKKSRANDGTRTPGSETARPGAIGQTRSRVSFAFSAPDDEDEDRHQQRDWYSMTIEELEEATLDIRRQMWELHSPGETE